MPRNPIYKGTFIRAFSSMLKDGKFYEVLEKSGGKDYESVDRITGAYTRACLLLLECDPQHKGWAYESGLPMTDVATARNLGVSPDHWIKMCKELMSVKLLERDKNKAWGIGKDKWEFYQGAVESRREYNKNYYANYHRKTDRDSSSATPVAVPAVPEGWKK